VHTVTGSMTMQVSDPEGFVGDPQSELAVAKGIASIVGVPAESINVNLSVSSASSSTSNSTSNSTSSSSNATVNSTNATRRLDAGVGQHLRRGRRLQGVVIVDYAISLRSDAGLAVSASDVESSIINTPAADFSNKINEAIETTLGAGTYTVTVQSKSAPEVAMETFPAAPTTNQPSNVGMTGSANRRAEACLAAALALAAAALA